VIGIDKYINADDQDLRNLQGAVADAKAIQEFLRDDLHVPAQNLQVLLDGDATRSNIIDAIAFLGTSTEEQIKPGSPILIYFAGHGATSEKKAFYKPTDQTACGHPKFEVLVPSDISLASESNPSIPVVTGIADYEIRSMLNDVANAKGNNIVTSKNQLIIECANTKARPSFWTVVILPA
jgi:hypothetical protein